MQADAAVLNHISWCAAVCGTHGIAQISNGDISGFIANLGAGVIGISNVFTAEGTLGEMWSDIAAIVSSEFPGLTLVGYESGHNLKSALLRGWESIGPLRVWIRSDQSS